MADLAQFKFISDKDPYRCIVCLKRCKHEDGGPYLRILLNSLGVTLKDVVGYNHLLLKHVGRAKGVTAHWRLCLDCKGENYYFQSWYQKKELGLYEPKDCFRKLHRRLQRTETREHLPAPDPKHPLFCVMERFRNHLMAYCWKQGKANSVLEMATHEECLPSELESSFAEAAVSEDVVTSTTAEDSDGEDMEIDVEN